MNCWKITASRPFSGTCAACTRPHDGQCRLGSEQVGIDGRITGVYSQSAETPLKTANFPPQWQEFEDMTSYADWRFVAEKAFLESSSNRPAGAPGTPGAPPTSGPGTSLGTSLGTPLGGASQ
jgi:hypothetical protein